MSLSGDNGSPLNLFNGKFRYKDTKEPVPEGPVSITLSDPVLYFDANGRELEPLTPPTRRDSNGTDILYNYPR